MREMNGKEIVFCDSEFIDEKGKTITEKFPILKTSLPITIALHLLLQIVFRAMQLYLDVK